MYPSRLLDLRDHNGDIVYLVDCGSLTTEPYFTLSHCWGGLVPVQLTRDSEAVLRGGLNVDQMPKTFQEAVHFCSYIGVGYLWIDSLCIFQGKKNAIHMRYEGPK